MRIQNNAMALDTQRRQGGVLSSLNKSAEKLSGSYRIHHAGDETAGLEISERMRARIRGLAKSTQDSQGEQSPVQNAESTLKETHNILQRMRKLAVQSASDENGADIDRRALAQEFAYLRDGINDIAQRTRWKEPGQTDETPEESGVPSPMVPSFSANMGIGSQSDALRALDEIHNALNAISNQRAALGAMQNRLEYNTDNIDAGNANAGRIRDADMAKEMAKSARKNMLEQAGRAMLAQANINPDNVLRLLI